MLLIIDNYDSFVFNVVRYCAELGHEALVRRNDALDLDAVERLAPSAIILSPGPATPQEAGLSLGIVQRFSGRVPLLGVCLGHQCIGAAFGGRITRAAEPMHGRASAISHDGRGLFRDLPDPLTVGRYHSLIVAETPQMAADLRVTARTAEGEVMALEHHRHPTLGVQFHPESILSQHGHGIFANFFRMAERWRQNAVA
ncbi:aminodeoxychorismate/anthranilate synthase component II [Pseudooceanicola sp. CBS1P-1]|uniref:Aminodeoxychorismate/anthranilate synthase component II n=1 Tax=Pseudooceanicola albus TaxID=2692189 RepID=A0A6L7G247_9RHOB|nr:MULTISPECIES: aminodeoxychorismate/anthranilate synthase component II [Pseudooceanicola]MBT9383754.1 aminodeoxychorismate/anthranilate synthase component II [Pseudooceanicola endophyticus]MXN17608.1 aminodeoxychorismate/anthranilate synthase component II [Pseudooceanicola albus]